MWCIFYLEENSTSVYEDEYKVDTEYVIYLDELTESLNDVGVDINDFKIVELIECRDGDFLTKQW